LAQFLLVCADEVWGRRAREALRSEGFDVEVEFDCTNVDARLVSCKPDVVGVDLSFPESLGVALCASIRATTAVAIFAVGPTVSEAAIVAALTAGADTVISKDASPGELIARVRALLRRFPPVGTWEAR
jgi:two-component system KDP operon response regulator KdpE